MMDDDDKYDDRPFAMFNMTRRFSLFFSATFTEPCYRNTPEFNTCVKRALQGLIPKLAKGNCTKALFRCTRIKFFIGLNCGVSVDARYFFIYKRNPFISLLEKYSRSAKQNRGPS
jgi:hypothetical protein